MRITRDRLRRFVASVVAVAMLAGTAAGVGQEEPDRGAGVEITAADHERITATIREQAAIEVSDWVWERYSDGLAHLNEAKEVFRRWRNTIPRDVVHGSRPPSEPYSLSEAREVLLKESTGKFNAALLHLEMQYWHWLSLHQVSSELLTEFREDVYRRQLLPANRRVPGANVDLIAILDQLSPEIAAQSSEQLAILKRGYAEELMDLLLEQAVRLDARRMDAQTVFDLREGGRHRTAPTVEEIERAARAAEIEGAIADHNARYLAELCKELPGEAADSVLQAWRRSVYPFLWQRSMEVQLAKIDDTSPRELRSLAGQIRTYQTRMHDRLWNAQDRATSFQNQVRARREGTHRTLWADFTELKGQAEAEIKVFGAAIDDLLTDGSAAH